MEEGVVPERTMEKLLTVVLGIYGRGESLIEMRDLLIQSSNDQSRSVGDSITLLMGMGSFGKLSVNLLVQKA